MSWSWKKLQTKSRKNNNCLWAGVVTALLVHLALLGLFRPLHLPDAQLADELPKLGSIDLARPENANLAQWLENHDPALIIAADNQSGASSIIRNFAVHPIPEDLPMQLRLSEPSPLKAPQSTPIQDSHKRVLALYWPDNTTAASYKTAAVWLNGKSFPAAEKLVRENVTEVPENAATTVIYVQNTPQVHTVGDRLKLLTGCGVPQLDEHAAKIIRSCMALDENLSGEIAFVWQKTPIAGKIREQQL